MRDVIFGQPLFLLVNDLDWVYQPTLKIREPDYSWEKNIEIKLVLKCLFFLSLSTLLSAGNNLIDEFQS